MAKKKWEEIEHSDIRVGDVIRHTAVFTEFGSITSQGKVIGHDAGDNSFRLDNTQWVFDDETYLVEDDATSVYTYRKVVETPPFVFPEGLGAVIRGRNGSGAKLERTLVRIEDDRYYVVETQAVATKHEIGLFYVDLAVVSEGYVAE